MLHLEWKVTEPPAEPLVDLATAKRHCRAVHTDKDDAILSALVDSAAEVIEERTGRSFIEREITLYADRFPCGAEPFELPRPPLLSVDSIEYQATLGEWTTMDEADYDVDLFAEPGKIRPKPGAVWPSVYWAPNVVRIVFTAGYGNAAMVPRRAGQACLLLVGHWFENREAGVEVDVKTLPLGFDAIVDSLWRPHA